MENVHIHPPGHLKVLQIQSEIIIKHSASSLIF